MSAVCFEPRAYEVRRFPMEGVSFGPCDRQNLYVQSHRQNCLKVRFNACLALENLNREFASSLENSFEFPGLRGAFLLEGDGGNVCVRRSVDVVALVDENLVDRLIEWPIIGFESCT